MATFQGHIFSDELGSSVHVLRAVLDALPDASHYDIMQGAEPYYTDARNFEPIEAARARKRPSCLSRLHR